MRGEMTINISTDAENLFDKIQYSFKIKTLNKQK